MSSTQQRRPPSRTSHASRRHARKAPSPTSSIPLYVLVGAAFLSLAFASLISIVSVVAIPYIFKQLEASGNALLESIATQPNIQRHYVSTVGSNLTYNEFVAGYASLGQPVVFASSEASVHSEQSRIVAIDDTEVSVSRVSRRNSGSVHLAKTDETLSLKQFRQSCSRINIDADTDQTEFVWDARIKTKARFDENLWPWPSLAGKGDQLQLLLSRFDDPQIRCSMSARGQGTNVMRQGRAFLNIVIEGEQHWLLFKANNLPPAGIHPNESIITYINSGAYANTTSEYTPMEATISAGQSLYIPEGYLFAFSTPSTPLSTSIQLFAARAEFGEAFSYCEEGLKAKRTGDLNLAVKLLKKSVSMEGGSTSSTWYELGEAQEALGAKDDALESYGNSIRSNRRNAEAYARLASLQQRKKLNGAVTKTIKMATTFRAVSQELLLL